MTASGAPDAPFRMLRCATPGIEAVAAQSRHSFARHSHEQYGIGVIRFGAQQSHSGRGQVEAAAGDVITVNPSEVHDGRPIGDVGRAWNILYFEPALLQAAAHDIFEDRTGNFELSQPVMGDRRAANILGRLFSAETGQPEETMRREELLLSLVAIVGRYRHKERNEAPAPVSLARSRIDDDPSSPHNLTELARIGGVSRFQLLRGFARATGLTPHAYVLQRRTDLARRLIARGMALSDAAAVAGFSDQSHMTRTFVRKFGISPGAYARAVL
ncbi:MAG TPA: AraC family transcriptional regulator [Allosphingosinicella sp.]|uniref:AraC family transcriptional regulator n=1 Tax=Allosphingosinicella sp. TaxID=2823234 RepID=UPI002EDB013B